MGSNKVIRHQRPRSHRFLGFTALLCTAIFIGPTAQTQSPTPDIVASYRILESRTLALTFTNGFFLQDGQIVPSGQVNRSRLHCKADRGTFDNILGAIEIFFSTAADGSNRVLLKTVPSTPVEKVTSIECLSRGTVFGFLDVQIAHGRVVELAR